MRAGGWGEGVEGGWEVVRGGGGNEKCQSRDESII